ncbi:excalibur calcium-binding domain-containing protein [Sphingomonas sp. ST-64]|uniref:Excalibur calcium-binding domain-containing protein n=1 Tax=Sphingomonas plantiphila TaxID=3163295 RepID=A0ABW8YLH9_9SPHN
MIVKTIRQRRSGDVFEMTGHPSGRAKGRSRPRRRGQEASFGAQLFVSCAAVGAITFVMAPEIESIWSLSTHSPEQIAAVERSRYFSGCDEARAAGVAPIHRGSPGYRSGMDGDGDGIACEPHR